jgi:superfamily II DNA/RNA helicase
VQYRTFHALFEGRDLMVRDKTGSGKTLAFALPIIERMRK